MWQGISGWWVGSDGVSDGKGEDGGESKGKDSGVVSCSSSVHGHQEGPQLFKLSLGPVLHKMVGFHNRLSRVLSLPFNEGWARWIEVQEV
jgi:hypothetical protein